MKAFNKKSIKTIAACAALATVLGVSGNTAASVDTGEISAEEMEPMPGASTYAALKQWYFKKQNGKLYRRLYNCQTMCWETDWLYVCPL